MIKGIKYFREIHKYFSYVTPPFYNQFVFLKYFQQEMLNIMRFFKPTQKMIKLRLQVAIYLFIKIFESFLERLI